MLRKNWKKTIQRSTSQICIEKKLSFWGKILCNNHVFFFIFWQSIMSVQKVSWRLFYCVHKRALLYVRRMIRLSGSLILFRRNEKICYEWTKKTIFIITICQNFCNKFCRNWKNTMIMHFRKADKIAFGFTFFCNWWSLQ